MDHWNFFDAGVSDARYEQLAGSESERLARYVGRRYLHFEIDEWDALPWWKQELYLEGLAEEGILKRAQIEHTGTANVDAGAGNPWASDAEFSAMGITVVN